MKTKHIPQTLSTLISLNAIILLFAILVFSSSKSYAQVPPLTIAAWDFENGLLPSESDPELEASAFNLTGVSNILIDNGTCQFLAYKGENWTEQTTIDSTQYYEFTVQPNPGRKIQLLRLVFNIKKGDMNGPGKGEVRSSLDGFSAGISPFPANPSVSNFEITENCEEIIIHLNALGNTFNNVAEPVTFRIYTYGALNAINKVDIDLVKLIGKVVPGGPLPVELVNFNATTEKEGVKVNWTTANEVNNEYFTVERSINGKEFTPIHTIKGAGNSTTTLDYEFLDINPKVGVSYYRLTQTDFDGKSSMSPIVSVKYVNNSAVNVYPNPATDIVNIQVQDIKEGIYSLTIFDLSGKLIKNEDIHINGSSVHQIPLNQLHQGIYYIKLDNGEYSFIKKFTKS